MKKYIQLLTCVVFVTLTISCSDTAEEASNYDKGEMLSHLTENIIVSSYEELESTTLALYNGAQTFTNNVSQETLESLRTVWLEARLSWKRSELYNFGPIENQFLYTKMDYFPISESKIEDAILDYDGTETFVDGLGSDRRGFAAIEYLIFDGTDEEVLARFTSTQYQGYLLGLTQNLAAISALILSDWQGGYADSFASSTGNDVGSSISLYTNAMIQLIEVIKTSKLADPYGLTSVTAEVRPDWVESPYAMVSMALITQNLQEVETIFTGGDGKGLDDYLTALDASDGEEDLAATIHSKIEECQTLAGEIHTLQDALTENTEAVENLLVAIQELITITKSDMMSQLGTTITFSSNDGD